MSRSRFGVCLCLLFALCHLAQSAEGHPGHDAGRHHAHAPVSPVTSFQTGLVHPLSGIDHLFPWLALGFWAAQQSGRKRSILPLAGLVGFGTGALAGLTSLQVISYAGWVELVAAGYGFLLAATIIASTIGRSEPASTGTTGSVLAAASFGLLTGLLHTSEATSPIVGLTYSSGMLASSAIICLMGALAATVVKSQRPLLSPYVSAAGLFATATLWLLPM
jgi:urease accessory protein